MLTLSLRSKSRTLTCRPRASVRRTICSDAPKSVWRTIPPSLGQAHDMLWVAPSLGQEHGTCSGTINEALTVGISEPN